MQGGAWVGPGTHRLGARQQQGPSGSQCANCMGACQCWKHDVHAAEHHHNLYSLAGCCMGVHDTLLQEECQHRTGPSDSFLPKAVLSVVTEPSRFRPTSSP